MVYHKFKAECNDSPHLEACRELFEKHCDESGLGDGIAYIDSVPESI